MDHTKLLLSGLIAVGLLLAPLMAVPVSAAAEPGYDYYVVGNPENVSTPTSPGLLLAGGGTDQDAAMQWLIDKSGGGDFVVIRASGTDAYNPYIYSELNRVVDSAATIIIKKERAAYDPFVIQTILNAEALFIAGGNQWDYVRDWKGTPVEAAIQTLASRGVPIGGTSAGLAVLGEFVFSAEHETITSVQALKNPYHPSVALATDFLELPFLGGVITDSHFVARDRMGRLLTFMARILNDGWASEVKGIAVNEKTALAVEADGSVHLFGQGPAYFLKANTPPAVCLQAKPLTFGGVEVYRISDDMQTFNLGSWTGSGGTGYMLSVQDGEVFSNQPNGDIY
jgi:cyanophycinase